METTINSAKFARRLQKIMESHELSATAFAEKLMVGRATISHLMSGRNKPSLDFVMKVVSTFSDVDINELLYGVKNTPTLPDTRVQKVKQYQARNIASETTPYPKEIPPIDRKKSSVEKSIERIVIFYKDGTFTTHLQENSK